MYSFAVSSIFTNSIGELGVGLAVMLGVLFLMTVLDLERRSVTIPWMSLGLGCLGFGLMVGLFVHPPSWFIANAIAWEWMWILVLVWIFSVTPWKIANPRFQLGLTTLQASTFLLLPMGLVFSQFSTDMRVGWLKSITDPQSPAITAITLIAALLLISGSSGGGKLAESDNLPLTLCLLLGTAGLGLLLGELFYIVIDHLIGV
jgi:hypothetical protein